MAANQGACKQSKLYTNMSSWYMLSIYTVVYAIGVHAHMKHIRPRLHSLVQPHLESCHAYNSSMESIQQCCSTGVRNIAVRVLTQNLIMHRVYSIRMVWPVLGYRTGTHTHTPYTLYTGLDSYQGMK